MNFSTKRITQEYSDIRRHLDPNFDPDKIINMQDLWELNADYSDSRICAASRESANMQEFTDAYCSRGTFDIVLERENLSVYYLTVHYAKRQSAAFLFFREAGGLSVLPDEINRLVAEFLAPNYVTLRLKMEHKEGYPFNGILWSLVDFGENMHRLNLRKYYEDLIAEYNCESATGWSPATRLDRNILSMLCKINNFDELQ
jgi:hypothetical protein